MKEFKLKSPSTGETVQVVINLSKYDNGRTAIQLLQKDLDMAMYTPYAVATVNLSHVLLADNEVLIKDYSENEGMLDFLTKNNIVSFTPNGVQSGYVWVPVCILNDESVWGETPNVYSLDEEPEYDSAGYNESDRKPLVASYVDVNERSAPNSNGWISMNKLDPAPDEINTITGKSMWKLKGYKVWADNYEQAQKLLPMIESF